MIENTTMYYSDISKDLIDNGYTPLPIVPRSKATDVAGWTSPDYKPPTGYSGYGTGIICGQIAGVDLDILNKDLCEEMTEYVQEKYGATIYRIGKWPKTLLVYRHENPERKFTSKEYDIGKVEILGAGQQFVAYGIHPDINKEYVWPGLLGGALENKAFELPVLSRADCLDIIEQFETLAAMRGFKLKAKDTNSSSLDDYDPFDPLDKKSPIGIDVSVLKDMVDKLDPDASRDEWRNVGMALHHETQGAPEGYELWDEWSAKGSKYKDGETEKQWASFGKYHGRPITAAYILKLAKEEEVTKDFFSSLDWSASRFVDEPPALPMVIYDMLPKSIVGLFFSAGGAGKSTLLLYMCAKIALAKEYDCDFFGRTIEPGKVVIVTAEDPDIIINKRYIGVLKRLALELETDLKTIRGIVDKNVMVVSTFGKPVHLFNLKDGSNLSTTSHYTSLKNCLSEIENLQLVVIDTKTRYSPAEGSGNVSATQEITYYEAIAQDTGAAVLLMHHTRKSGRDNKESGSQAYRDATGTFDACRAAWYLRGLNDDELAAQEIPEESKTDYLYLENAKNNYVRINEPMILHRESYGYTKVATAKKLNANERKERAKQKYYDKIMCILQSEKGSPFAQSSIIKMCKNEGIGRQRVVSTLTEIVEDGLLLKTDGIGRGFSHSYELTEQGKLYNLEII